MQSTSIAPDWLWLAFSIGIVVLLFVDLAIFGKHSEKAKTKTALLESLLWIATAMIFNVWFALEYGRDLGLEFLTGYLVEKSLSIDNLFVILLIFSSLKIPTDFQHKVLFLGILGAIVLRALFIIVGAEILARFHFVFYIFGGILIITAVNFLRGTDTRIDTDQHWSIRFVKRFIPVTDKFDNGAFFVRDEGGLKATPLFLALIVVEATDLIFAVDSIPAVFAVTQDSFIAFSSNIMAILGLRALYFVLAEWVGKLRYLKPGLATILGFIGVKMLLVDLFHIPSWISLLVIVAVLTSAALSSWYVNRVQQNGAPH